MSGAAAWVTHSTASAVACRPALGMHRLRRDLGDAVPGVQRDVALAEHAAEASPHRGIVGRQDGLAVGQQFVVQAARVIATFAQQGGEAMLRRQGQFHAAGAATDNDHAERPLAGDHPILQSLPLLQPGVDRFHRHGMGERAGDIDRARSRAGIDRQQVERDRWPPTGDKLAVLEIQALHLGMVETRPGETRQWTEVDVAVVIVVQARDITRQHAGIGRVDVARDQGQAHPGHRLHAKSPQHRDVRVSATDEYQVLYDGCI